jgi:hypothetical protein
MDTSCRFQVSGVRNVKKDGFRCQVSGVSIQCSGPFEFGIRNAEIKNIVRRRA